MSGYILPQKVRQGQAPFVTGSEQSELESLRRYKNDVQRVLAASWQANTKIVQLELLTQATYKKHHEIQHKGKTAVEIPTTARALGERLNISNKTVSNAIHQLQGKKLIEWKQPETEVYHAKTGRFVDRQEARHIDPRTIGPGKEYNYRKGNGTVFVGPLPPKLPELSATTYDRKQKTKATGERARLKEALAFIEKAQCPECGAEGEIRAVCTGCGCQITVESLATDGGGEVLPLHEHTPARPTPPAAALSFDDDDPFAGIVDDEWSACDSFELTTFDTNTPTPQPAAPAVVEKITQLHIEAVKITHPPLPQPLNDTPGERVKVLLNAAIGAYDRVIVQLKEQGTPKYKTLDAGVKPNLDAYLRGDKAHVYGSRPALPNGESWVLFADNDLDAERPGLTWEELKIATRKMRRAHIQTVLLRREGDKARLVWYFTRPVAPEKARRLMLIHAPELAALAEWFPANSGGGTFKDCRDKGVSWSLTRIKAKQAIDCPMYAETDCGAVESPGWLHGEAEQERIAWAFERSITAARLVDEVADDPSDYEPQSDAAGASTQHLVSAVKPSITEAYRGNDRTEELRAGIVWFNATHIPADFGIPETGFFKCDAIRKETVGSIHADYDEYGRHMYTDFGDGNKKYDLFEIHVFVNYGGDKKRAQADLMREYRAHFAKTAEAA